MRLETLLFLLIFSLWMHLNWIELGWWTGIFIRSWHPKKTFCTQGLTTKARYFRPLQDSCSVNFVPWLVWNIPACRWNVPKTLNKLIHKDNIWFFGTSGWSTFALQILSIRNTYISEFSTFQTFQICQTIQIFQTCQNFQISHKMQRYYTCYFSSYDSLIIDYIIHKI